MTFTCPGQYILGPQRNACVGACILGKWFAKRPAHVHYQVWCLLAAWQAHVTYCAWSPCSWKHATPQGHSCLRYYTACNDASLSPHLSRRPHDANTRLHASTVTVDNCRTCNDGSLGQTHTLSVLLRITQRAPCRSTGSRAPRCRVSGPCAAAAWAAPATRCAPCPAPPR